MFKSLGYVRFFLTFFWIFIQKEWIKLFKSDSKYIIFLISNKCCFELSILLRILKKYILSINKMISDGLCATEDWCNENSALSSQEEVTFKLHLYFI